MTFAFLYEVLTEASQSDLKFIHWLFILLTQPWILIVIFS